MSGLFGGKPKTVETPPVPPPEAIPEVDEEDIKRPRRRRGRPETRLTGELVPVTEKKKLLG